MKNKFKPKTKLERYGFKIYSLLVENFPRTYFVGGTVRDFLLDKKTTDIDIATEGLPKDVVNILKKNHVSFSENYQSMGVIECPYKKYKISIVTLRKEQYGKSRFPKIVYIKDIKTDAKRRDFTINSMYLRGKSGKIYDFSGGLGDLKNKKIKFVGDPETKIKQDPLRILRALRFSLTLRFKIESKSLIAIKKNFGLLSKTVSKNKIYREIKKIGSLTARKKIFSTLVDQKMLDKYF